MKYTPLQTGATPTVGTSGQAVKDLQIQLNTQNQGQAGYTPLKVDGMYGQLTQNASQFKSANAIVDPIKKTTGYASSNSKLGEYNQNSTTLDSKLNTGANATNGISGGSTTDSTKTGTGVGTGDTKTPVTPLPKEPKPTEKLDLDKVWDTEKEKLDPEYKKKKEDAEKLYQTQFANFDQGYASDVSNINSIYEQRMETRKRLDKIDIDRRKAYGLGASGNAQYMPVEYSDAITNKERESADEIKRLDLERSNLLSKAKQARDSGQANLLKENMDRINTIEEKMRTQIKEAVELASKQNTIDIAKEKADKEEFTRQIQERAKRAVLDLGDEYNNAKTPEEKDAIIKKAIEETGGNPTDNNLLINMTGAFKTNADTVYKDSITKQKDALAIETSKTNNLKKISDMTKKGAPKKLTVTEQNKIVNDTSAEAVLTFKDLASKSPTKTLDKKIYNDFREVFQKEHGANALLKLEKQLKDNNVRISK